MIPKSLTSVGFTSAHRCDQCGETAATIEDTGGSYALLCNKCGESHGPMTPEAIRFIEDTIRIFGAPCEPVTITRAITEIGMNRDDLFPSKYLKAADLGGKPTVVEITGVTMEDLKDMAGKTQRKGVLAFKDRTKTLVLNRTNYDAVADLHGEETNGWPGKSIELFPAKTNMGGKTMDCIRVRGTTAQTMNDAISF